MSEVSLNDVGPMVIDLLAILRPGEEIGVLQDGQRIATIRKEERREVASYPCKAGSAHGTCHWMSDDFDAPLDDFREYME